MADTEDMGFDAVLAGEKWEAPPEPTTSSDPESQHNLQAPVTAAVIAPAPVGLTAEGVQAAKALVALPPMTPMALAQLARSVAMDVLELHAVLKEHKLTQVQYDFLAENNAFYKHALEAACIEWHSPLTTQERLKIEAAAILEDCLPGLGARMQNKGEGLPGVVEAAKLFAKVAGVGEREVGVGSAGERFTINIDLGGDQKITVATAPQAQRIDPQDQVGAIPMLPERP